MNTMLNDYLESLSTSECGIADTVLELSRADGVGLIAEERQRHFDVEGWTPKHDDEHVGEELASAAACYATPMKWRPFPVRHSGQAPMIWPWSPKWWKPGDRIRELQKAGALIAAEIDRLLRTPKESVRATLKIGIMLDSWKLPVFQKHLDAAGYKYKQTDGVLAPGVITLTVETDSAGALEQVVNVALAEAAQKGPAL